MRLLAEGDTLGIDERAVAEQHAESSLVMAADIEEIVDDSVAPAEGLESHLARHFEGGNAKDCPVIGGMDAVAVNALVMAVQQRSEKAKQFSGLSGADIAARAKARREQSQSVEKPAEDPEADSKQLQDHKVVITQQNRPVPEQTIRREMETILQQMRIEEIVLERTTSSAEKAEIVHPPKSQTDTARGNPVSKKTVATKEIPQPSALNEPILSAESNTNTRRTSHPELVSADTLPLKMDTLAKSPESAAIEQLYIPKISTDKVVELQYTARESHEFDGDNTAFQTETTDIVTGDTTTDMEILDDEVIVHSEHDIDARFETTAELAEPDKLVETAAQAIANPEQAAVEQVIDTIINASIAEEGAATVRQELQDLSNRLLQGEKVSSEELNQVIERIAVATTDEVAKQQIIELLHIYVEQLQQQFNDAGAHQNLLNLIGTTEYKFYANWKSAAKQLVRGDYRRVSRFAIASLLPG